MNTTKNTLDLESENLPVPLSHAETPDEPQSEAALRATIKRYRRILQSADETAIITLDSEGIVTGWSEGARQILGWSEAEMLGQSLGRIFPEEDGGVQLLQTEISNAASRGTGRYEGWRVRKNGEHFWAIGETKPLSRENLPGSGFVKILQDRTEHRHAESVIREHARALEILNRVGTVLARETALDNVAQVVTDAGVALTGAEFGAFFYTIEDAAGEKHMRCSLSGISPEAFPKLSMPKNAEVFSPTFSDAGIFRSGDITQDPRYKKNAPYFGMLEGGAPVCSYLAVPVVSRNGEVIGGLFFGHASCGVFTENSERSLTGLAGEAAVAIDNVRLFEETQREIAERRRAEVALIDLNAQLEEQVKARTEELLQSAEALRQAQKMEAVGQLTGGIAHDFNNLLQVICGNLGLLARTLPAEPPMLRQAAAQAMNGAKRAASLTRRLLAFARRQPLDPKPLNANNIVSGMSELFRRALGETIELKTNLTADLWQTEVDPNELESALLNLAVNARDAMPAGGGLIIETSNKYLDPSYAARHADVSAGQYAEISVSDTGSGIDAKTLERVFEPFFTTKAEGKGTGLGLSQVYGFVKQSRGHLQIYSEVGIGTTVKIYLPMLEGDMVPNADGGVTFTPAARTGETILVVEDDPDVRAYTVSALRELNYAVIEAADGPAAIGILEAGEVDLIFTDVVLPGGMTGADVVKRAKELKPTARSLFTSGYARDAIVHNGRLDRGVQLLTKPFSFEELATKVREVLDSRLN